MRVVLAAVIAAVAAAGCGDDATAAPDRFRVLVFSNTTAFRHDSIPAGVEAIRLLGERHRFGVDHTEDPGRFTRAGLARYDALVFLSTTGEPLPSPAQRRAFRGFIRAGGGFLGIHAASDSFYRWPWYVGLVGASFRRHGPGTPPATLVVEDRTSAATRHLPRRWPRSDEWYAFRSNPRARVHVLLSIDERSYDPGRASMGADHPLAWCRRYDGGRSVYTALGHTEASYTEPRFTAHLRGAIEMAAGQAAFDCPPGNRADVSRR